MNEGQSERRMERRREQRDREGKEREMKGNGQGDEMRIREDMDRMSKEDDGERKKRS